MKKLVLISLAISLTIYLICGVSSSTLAKTISAKKGEKADLVLLPKFISMVIFDQVNEGAQEAHTYLNNRGQLIFFGVSSGDSTEEQIKSVKNFAKQGKDGIMLANNAGDRIVPSAAIAQKKGVKIVTWETPIPSAQNEDLFISPVDLSLLGEAIAKLSLSLVKKSGEVVILATSPNNAQENAWIKDIKKEFKNKKYGKIKLLNIVYGNNDPTLVYNLVFALLDKYPLLELIISPSVLGTKIAAQAVKYKRNCKKVRVSGLGLPKDLLENTLNGCIPKFILWDFRDLGYLTYYATYLLSTGQMQGEIYEKFEAGRMGTFTIEADPNRPQGKWVIMGDFKIYDKNNVAQAAR